MDNARNPALSHSQELAVRCIAAKHLRGIPAHHNALRISELRAVIEAEAFLAELTARDGADELARWESLEESVDWAAV